MKERAELIGAIERQIRLADKIFAAIAEAESRDIALLGRTANAAVLLAGLMENWYSCFESAWQKISQAFENHLAEHRWHADLLERMTLSVEGVRAPAVSDENYSALLELLKFRHFRRYYYELEYDWDRLDFLLKKLRQAHPRAVADLRHFQDFLRSL